MSDHSLSASAERRRRRAAAAVHDSKASLPSLEAVLKVARKRQMKDGGAYACSAGGTPEHFHLTRRPGAEYKIRYHPDIGYYLVCPDGRRIFDGDA